MRKQSQQYHQSHKLSLKNLIQPRNSHFSSETPQFAWGQRWLNGPQYALMLQEKQKYSQKYGLMFCQHNQHPLQIYDNPVNGMVYFMEGNSLETFGFPRIHKKKIYRWKKMNFTTNLPKPNPIVTYLVASSIKTGSLEYQNQEQFRMHAVIPFNTATSHILCHIKQVVPQRRNDGSGSKDDENIQWCFQGGEINYYRLFAILHNHHYLEK